MRRLYKLEEKVTNFVRHISRKVGRNIRKLRKVFAEYKPMISAYLDKFYAEHE